MIETIFSVDGEEMEPGTEEGGNATEGGEETPETPSEEPAGRLQDGEEEEEKNEDEKEAA